MWVGNLAVSVFGLTAVDLVVVVAVAWRGRSVVDLEEVSVSSVSPVSVVGGFVFAFTLTAFVNVTVSPTILDLSWTYLDLRNFVLLPSPAIYCVYLFMLEPRS